MTKRTKPIKNANQGRRFLVLISAVSFIVLAVFGSCSLQYNPEMAEELTEEIPDTVLYDFERVVVQNAKPRFRLQAKKGSIFEKAGKIRMESVDFTEYALDGSGATGSGHADSGIFFTKTESAELNGSVFFSSSRDSITVSSGYLYWDGKERTIASRLDTVTTVTSKQSTLSGAGFKGDAKTREYSFMEHITGSYRSSEKETP